MIVADAVEVNVPVLYVADPVKENAGLEPTGPPTSRSMWQYLILLGPRVIGSPHSPDKSFAGAGEEDGKCRTCHGLAVDSRSGKPLLLVCDRENRRLVRFDLDGKYVDTIATGLRRPCAVAFRGACLAIAELEGRVTILDEKNAEIAHLGDNPDSAERANYSVPPASCASGMVSRRLLSGTPARTMRLAASKFLRDSSSV